MPKIFLSYSHKDEEWKDRLVAQLGVLQMQGLLEIWEDRQIAAGEDWLPAITTALDSCHVAVLLISANFLTSKFILGAEVPRLLERRQNEGVRVIPLIIKPCAWQKVAWLKPIQARPKDGQALSGGNDHQIDTDLAALANEIAELLHRSPVAFRSSPLAPPPSPFAPLPPEKLFTAKLPTTSGALFGREQDLRRLDEAWADPHTHILTLVAWGGVGKTALVNEWLNQIARDNYRGAERVYAWSFYSQGTREERQVSADEFLAHALKWFGDPDPKAGAPWEKGARLAALLRQQKTLLVLDGLEPLQYPPGPLHGQLKDQGVQALLKELAGDNAGLCIVTTRVHVADLAHKTQGPVLKGSVQAVALENLSAEAGGQLLRHLGVYGTAAELAEAAAEFHGHALALSLLGSYLATVHEGEVRKRDLIPHLIDKEEQPGYHAYRVMASYEHWLAATPELDLLYLMGLFDRPAAKGAMDALLAPPAIAGLTSNLQNLPFAKLQFALKRLRELRLLAEKDTSRPDGDRASRGLDCHPLVREHFGEKLRQQNPAAWKEAHSRLYEYYKKLPAKELPDTLEEMEPLFAAVAHGCQAGNPTKVWEEVYWPQINRGNEAYSEHKLGAFGAHLSALSNFFEILWSTPATGLSDSRKALVLSFAGFGLRALGRLREAAQPMQAGMELLVSQEDWKRAAANAGNLSELYITLGEVSQAVASARQSVDFADRSGDGFQKEVARTQSGDALHQSGELTEAHKFFREAEAMQQQRQPEYAYLYSLRGFQFCDLLLSQGQYQEVQKRARQTIEIANRNHWLLDIALDKLSLGRAFLLQALTPPLIPPQGGTRSNSPLEGGTRSNSPLEGGQGGVAPIASTATAFLFTQARDYLQQAVAGLREAGRQDILPLCLFARAACYRAQNEFALASADLEEAREIAERGEMKLYLADYHLEACRMCLAQHAANAPGVETFRRNVSTVAISTPVGSTTDHLSDARQHLATAKEMIAQMGYGRRTPEVEELQEQLRSIKT